MRPIEPEKSLLDVAEEQAIRAAEDIKRGKPKRQGLIRMPNGMDDRRPRGKS